MSTVCTHYVIYGARVDFDSDLSEKLEDYIDDPHSDSTNPKDRLTALIDGMNGEYIILGEVLAKAGQEGFEQIVDVDEYGMADRGEAQRRVRDVLGYFDAMEYGVYVVSHWR